MFPWLQQISEKWSLAGFFDWSNLYAIGRSPLTAVAVYGTVVVPSLAVLVSVASRFGFLGLLFFRDASMPTSMWLAYIFSLVFGFAAILSLISCPAILKRYHTFDEYLLQIIRISERIKGTTDNGSTDKQPDFNIVQENDVVDEAKADRLLDMLAYDIGKTGYDETVDNILKRASTEWENARTEKKELRYAIGGLYFFSFGLGFVLFFILMPVSLLNL